MCESTTVNDMGSMEIMHLPNDAPQSLDSADFSIISEHPLLVNGDVSENSQFHGTINMSSLHSALMSATPDLSYEELQNRLAEVVEDNVSLRETMSKTNELMNQQLSSISAWHNELTTSMSKQQLDLKETKERIKELEDENKQLHEKLKEQETMMKNGVDSGTTMRDITPLSDEELDFEIVNRKELKNPAQENKLKETEQLILALKNIIDDQNKQIETLKKQPKDASLSTKVKEPFENNEKSTEPFDEKIKELEKSLMAEQAKYEEERVCHSETKKMLSTVQTNYDRVTKLLQIQSRDERDKNTVDIEREMDTKMYLEQIDKVTAQLIDYEQKLQEETDKVQSLTSELNALKEDAETIPILKAQIDVYKMDLESTTLAKEAAQEEVNRLTKQLHETSSLSFCDSCRVSIAGGSSRGKGRKKSPTKRPELKQKDDMYVCPVCTRAFTTLAAVEGHVNSCIDQS